jgi:hypothetical protein
MTTLNQLSAIDAAHAASNTSPKYGFISSRAIIDNLQNVGFTTRQIQIQKVNKEERKGFQKHVVRMRHESSQLAKVGDEFPEVVLINAHDGSSSLKMMLGIFRLVCSNGMVSGSIQDEVKFIHKRVNIELIQEAATRLISNSTRLTDVIGRMKSKQLSYPEKISFLSEAAKIRYNEPEEKQIQSLDYVRRYDDNGDNLWRIFNRVQENLTQGRRYSGIRKITSAGTDVAVNRELWNVAEAFLN